MESYAGNQQANIASVSGLYAGQTGRQLLGKHEEARLAMQHILHGLNTDIGIAALERAVATVKAHLEAEA